MHEAVDLLAQAVGVEDTAQVYAVTHKALASAVNIIARATTPVGIGDACRRLLELHPKAVAAASVPVGKLIDWMMTFQFDGDVDFFELDPVAGLPGNSSDGATVGCRGRSAAAAEPVAVGRPSQ
jgi:hypothetical protein